MSQTSVKPRAGHHTNTAFEAMTPPYRNPEQIGCQFKGSDPTQDLKPLSVAYRPGGGSTTGTADGTRPSWANSSTGVPPPDRCVPHQYQSSLPAGYGRVGVVDSPCRQSHFGHYAAASANDDADSCPQRIENERQQSGRLSGYDAPRISRIGQESMHGKHRRRHCH